MRKKKPEDTLEEYLNEQTIPDDPELAALARAADRLERGLNVEAPEAYRERALFIQGVAARKPGFPWARLMVPVMAASVFVAFVAISRDARPGDTLYGVRTALDNVGLAEDPDETASDLLREAEAQVEQGEDLLDREPPDFQGARRAVDTAIVLATEAQDLLDDASGDAQEDGRDRAQDVKDDAYDLREDIAKEKTEQIDEQLEEAAEESGADHEIGDDDNSGSGSSGSGGDDDNSGSGSDDSGGDDNSGSGSDDSGGDDSSGSGSGSDDSGGSGSDDSSGSGSGGDDSSGSGSDDN